MRALSGPLAGRDDLSAVDLEEAYALDAPALRANFVLSLDGATAIDGVSGSLGGPADKAVFATLRALTDVVLVGAGTVRAEGYGPAWLGAERRARRIERGQTPLPTVAVVTFGADLDPSSRLFTERRDDQPAPPRPLVLTSASAPAERVEALGAVATVVPLGDDRVDPGALAAELARRGLVRALCEGGASLLGQLAAAGLVDDLCLTYAPLLAGPGHPTLAGDPQGSANPTPTRFHLVHLLEGDGLLLARYAAGPGPTPAGAGLVEGGGPR